MKTQQKALLLAQVSGTEPARGIKQGHPDKMHGTCSASEPNRVSHERLPCSSQTHSPSQATITKMAVMQHPHWHSILCEKCVRKVFLVRIRKGEITQTQNHGESCSREHKLVLGIWTS